jgi:hypothetical protein
MKLDVESGTWHDLVDIGSRIQVNWNGLGPTVFDLTCGRAGHLPPPSSQPLRAGHMTKAPALPRGWLPRVKNLNDQNTQDTHIMQSSNE